MNSYKNTNPMHIKNIRTYRLEIKLAQSYEVAYAHYDSVENAVVRMKDEFDNTGWG